MTLLLYFLIVVIGVMVGKQLSDLPAPQRNIVLAVLIVLVLVIVFLGNGNPLLPRGD